MIETKSEKFDRIVRQADEAAKRSATPPSPPKQSPSDAEKQRRGVEEWDQIEKASQR